MITTGTKSVEWKESWINDFLKTLRGLANAAGDTFLIGLSNKENPVHLYTAPKLLKNLPNKIRHLLGIIPAMKLVLEAAFAKVEIHMPVYPATISYRRRYYQRVGSTTQEKTDVALNRLFLRRHGGTSCGVPLPGLSLTDQDARKIMRFRTRKKTSGQVGDSVKSEPDNTLLKRIKLTDGTYLKRTGGLLFYPDPAKFLTSVFVNIGFSTPTPALLNFITRPYPMQALCPSPPDTRPLIEQISSGFHPRSRHSAPRALSSTVQGFAGNYSQCHDPPPTTNLEDTPSLH